MRKDSFILFKNKSLSYLWMAIIVLAGSCDFIRIKREAAQGEPVRKPVARVGNSYLFQDELIGIAPGGVIAEDSVARVTAYVNSWVRKQLVINEAMKNIDIDELEVERKVLDYRYSLIGYEYQNYYIRQNLNDSVSDQEIEEYYKARLDNFILKQNIIKGTYIKVPKTAPRTQQIKGLMFSKKTKDQTDFKSYCIGFSAAYHMGDSSWIEFDKLVVNSPLFDIPNKVQFLRNNNYYETSDNEFLYFLKIDGYKISDNVSPLEFVKQDIKNIILNKRKVELARKLEDDVYENAAKRKDFEVFSN